MQLDASKYLDYLDEMNTSREHKLELIGVIARMMEAFVDLAFGQAPEQNLVGKRQFQITAADPDTIGSGLTITPPFNDAANEETARKQTP